VTGRRDTYPRAEATFSARVVDANCSRAIVNTLGNLYVESTILFANMTQIEDTA
jgi:hypothetical protein